MTEKPWGEQSTDEKLNTLHRSLMSLENKVDNLDARFNNLIERIEDYSKRLGGDIDKMKAQIGRIIADDSSSENANPSRQR